MSFDDTRARHPHHHDFSATNPFRSGDAVQNLFSPVRAVSHGPFLAKPQIGWKAILLMVRSRSADFSFSGNDAVGTKTRPHPAPLPQREGEPIARLEKIT